MDTASRIASTARALTERPSTAPFRSTTCSQEKPARANLMAWSAGELLKTVALSMSPWSRRTHWPSLRSMAG